MSEAAAFADGVARVASTALSGANIRTDVFAIGNARFQLTAPVRSHEDWLGRALLRRPPPPHGEDALHRMTVWDGLEPDALPPRAPWVATAPEPLGLVGSHSDDVIRCAVDIHTNSLMVTNFARNSSHTWYPSIPALPAW